MKKRPKKIILWQQHHLHLNVAIQKKVFMSSNRWECWRRSCCRHLQQSHYGENNFTLLSYRRWRGRNKSQNQETWHTMTLILKTWFTKKNIKKKMDPYSLRPSAICQRRKGGGEGGSGGGEESRGGAEETLESRWWRAARRYVVLLQLGVQSLALFSSTQK